MDQTHETMVQPAEETRAQKKSKKPLIFILALACLLAAARFGLGYYAKSLDTFWAGTNILRQDVSGMTVQEATDTLEAALPEIELFIYYLPDDLAKEDRPEVPDHFTISLADLGLTAEAADIVNTAWAGQNRESPWNAGISYWKHRTGRVFINYTGKQVFAVDETKLAAAASPAAQALSQAAVDAAYELNQDTISIQVPMDGWQIDAAVLEELLLSLDWISDLSLKAPYTVLPAKALTARQIYNETAGEMRNAAYDTSTDTISAEQVGVRFSVSDAQAMMDGAAPGDRIEIPANIEYPTVTAQQLEELLFRDVLGECRTHVGGTAARKTNVRLASAAFHNVVLNAGDVFSYNGTVGQRTAEKGYQAAPAYFQGETIDEIGGGVCQPSSTLYLACLRANLEITERYAHRYTPSYIPWGMDATVSWGGPDYKFSNNTEYPIKIITEYKDNYLTVKLLGTNITGVTAKMTNEQLSTTPYEVVYEEDPTLAPGQEKEKTSPYNGALVKTYRHLYDADGKLISSAYEATSNYKVRNQVILRGPAVETESPVETPQETPGEATVPETPDEATGSTEAEIPVAIIPDPTEPAA